MKNSQSLTHLSRFAKVSLGALMFVALISGCHKTPVVNPTLHDFKMVDLVANNAAYGAVLTDPTLSNAWGLAWSPTGVPWVNSLGGHVSEVYSAEGAIVRPPVNIPSPTDTIGGLPTGIVFSGGAGFMLSNAAAASFIFAG